jgi:N-acyl-phosphatidylethanolamine-hydrolysing phospholipase D
MRTYDRRPDSTRRGSLPTAEPAPARPRAAADALTLTWAGHSTFLIQIGGRNVLTDPMWSEVASPVRVVGPRRYIPPGIALDDLPSIDLVVQSHDHYDHLDVPTVGALARRFPDAEWLAPLGLARWLERRGIRRVRELDWWDETNVAGLRVGAVPAQHFSGRGPRRNRALWCGWTLRAAASDRAVYFVGDTGYFPVFGAIAERRGPFDAVLMPIGAYDPRWFMRPAHLDPEEAVRAYAEIVSRQPARTLHFVAMHWGTFKLTEEPLLEPPERLRVAWENAALPVPVLHVLRHGETRRIAAGDTQGAAFSPSGA